jgi:hypothetical protein
MPMWDNLLNNGANSLIKPPCEETIRQQSIEYRGCHRYENWTEGNATEVI